MTDIRLGTAGWSIAARHRDAFPEAGSQLARYAARFDAVEINSSFYRPHRRSTYERWADAVPATFRFAVKIPKVVTHERRLRDCEAEIAGFLDETGGLELKFAVALVQLPPSLAFDRGVTAPFFADLRQRCGAAVACEPRHTSWFTGEADALLAELGVARVAADPAIAPGADKPGGSGALTYLRLHGAPRVYYSDYPAERLAAIEAALRAVSRSGAPVWCIFDNTAEGHALGNALALAEAFGVRPARASPGGGSA